MKALTTAMPAAALFVAACGNELVEPPTDGADPTETLTPFLKVL
jgi:hypothetical protein